MHNLLILINGLHANHFQTFQSIIIFSFLSIEKSSKYFSDSPTITRNRLVAYQEMIVAFHKHLMQDKFVLKPKNLHQPNNFFTKISQNDRK